MTPEGLREMVLPEIVSSWEDHCFCASPGFRKLLSFDFRDFRKARTREEFLRQIRSV